MNLTELTSKEIDELVFMARKLKIKGIVEMRKQELIFALLQAQMTKNGWHKKQSSFSRRYEWIIPKNFSAPESYVQKLWA